MSNAGSPTNWFWRTCSGLFSTGGEVSCALSAVSHERPELTGRGIPMDLRSTLNNHPRITVCVVTALACLALALSLAKRFHFGPRVSSNSAFYTDDDGQTLFQD